MCLWIILALGSVFHGEKAKLCRRCMCTAPAVCCSMRMLWRSGLPAKCHGPLPLELLGTGPPSIAQVVVIVPWVCDYPKQGWKCQLSQRGLYPLWGKWSECAQRGGKVHRPSSQDLSPARLLCVKQCSPLRLYKCTFPSCSSAWRFLGWVTCEHLGSPCLISFPGNQHGALLLSKNSPEHSDLQFFIRNSVGSQWAGDSCRRQLKENQSAVLGDLGPPSPEGHLLNIKEITLWVSLSFCWSICLAFANQL